MESIIDKWGRKRKAIWVDCPCGQRKLMRTYSNKPLPMHCSQECSTLYQPRAELTILKCAICGIEFERSIKKLVHSKSGIYFCSRKCKDEGQKLGGISEIQPGHYGTGIPDYRPIAFKNHPHKCNRCNYNKHIEVLVVHHKDRNRQNNDPANLEILCPTCHMEDHFLSKDGLWSKVIL